MNFLNKLKDVFYTSPELLTVEEELKQEYLNNLELITKNILSQKDAEITWNTQIDTYSKELVKIREFLKILEVPENKITIDKLIYRINQFIAKAKNPVYEIAFVGAVKAGKSTLLNAILDKNLASTEVTPETAALTKFKASDKGQNYLKISFYNENEWNLLWKSAIDSKAEVFLEDYKKLNAEEIKMNWINKKEDFILVNDLSELKIEISKYTSSKSAVHYFVKEVEVGLSDFNIPSQVCFVDTPGLDDVVDFRSNITRQYIDSANAVIVCVKSDSLRNDELLTISRVFANTRNNPEKVFVVGTQVDGLNNPKLDWEKQKEEWTKYLKGKSCYDSVDLTKKNLIGTSAYTYNFSIRYEELDEQEKQSLAMYCIKPGVDILTFSQLGDMKNILPMKLQDIKERSNVINLKGIIEKNLLAKYNESLIDDFNNKYISIKGDIDDYAKKQIDKVNEFVKLSNTDLETIKKEREKKVLELEEVEKRKEELDVFLSIVKKHISKTSEQLMKDIKAIGNDL